MCVRVCVCRHRPSAERFPIIVSQDCGDVATADAIAKYGDKVTHIKVHNCIYACNKPTSD